MYKPENWVIVKINDVYKVFGGWRGGFATGDSWKLNSGIESIEENEDLIDIKGYSGSIYRVHRNTYGIYGSYLNGVLDNFKDQAEKAGIVFKVFDSYDDHRKEH